MDSKVVNEAERALVEATQKLSPEKGLNVPLVADHVRAIEVGGSADNVSQGGGFPPALKSAATLVAIVAPRQ